MILTIIIAVGVLITLAALIPAFRGTDPDTRTAGKTITGVALIITLIITAFATTTIVAPRTVGVKVAFGKPVGAVSNGLHVKAPWTKIEKLDGAIQNDVFTGDNTITVRLGNNAQAQADASIRWQLKTANAEQLFLDYKTFDNIRDNLVTRNFRAAMNEAFADYNPLATVTDANTNDADGYLARIAEQVTTSLRDKIGEDIHIHDVTIPIVRFDESTQTKIDELQAEIARTRVAEQKQQTAEAERKANEILDRSVSENVLTSKCLDIADRNNKDILGCIPGTTGQPIVGSRP